MNTIRIWAYVALIIFMGNGCLAQQNYFPFFSTDSTQQKKLAETCCKQVKESFVLEDKVSSKYKKEFNEYKDNVSEYVKDMITYTAVFDTVIYPFIQNVFMKICEGNPDLKKYNIVVSDLPMMNASSVGGNTIVFYAPLISLMENEDQVAAVLCHELAHGELQHNLMGIKKKLDAYFNAEFQKELDKTSKEKYNVNKKLNNLILRYAFTSRFHDREYEKAADSLGYMILRKTSYNASEMVKTIERLKHAEEPPFKDPIDYSVFFKCPAVTYDFSKIKPYQKTSLFAISNEAKLSLDSLRDSLRTHPDCDKRMTFITTLMQQQPQQNKSLATDNASFSKVKWASAMEMIMGYFSYGAYDLSLYNAIIYASKYPNDEFINSIISINMNRLTKSLKDHELSDYLSNYNDGNDSTFNNFLFFINELRLSEMMQFTKCFEEQHSASIKNPEYKIVVNYGISRLYDDGKEKTWQEQYKKDYSNGRFKYYLDLQSLNKKKK